jgi:hypothetical protein
MQQVVYLFEACGGQRRVSRLRGTRREGPTSPAQVRSPMFSKVPYCVSK